MRIKDPKTTALIFASGKMVVTGAKSEEQSKFAARKFARVIQKLGFDVQFSDFKIQNMVGSCDVQFPIRLEGLQYSHSQFSTVWVYDFLGQVAHLLSVRTGIVSRSHLPNGSA